MEPYTPDVPEGEAGASAMTPGTYTAKAQITATHAAAETPEMARSRRRARRRWRLRERACTAAILSSVERTLHPLSRQQRPHGSLAARDQVVDLLARLAHDRGGLLVAHILNIHEVERLAVVG